MSHSRHRSPPLVPATLAALLVLMAGACSSPATTSTASAGSANRTSAPPCPVATIPVVVTVDQWGEIAQQLAGACGEVTTIVQGSSADPHEYEPTPADSAAFSKAKLVVMNGLDYDAWASRVIDTLPTKPAVVNGGDVVGLKSGDNPHIWYGPEYVTKVSESISAQLRQSSPAASAYFDQQAAAWKTSMQPYFDTIRTIKASSAGRTYGATESVFAYMADALGLKDETPEGYRNAAANEAEPSPGDLSAFQKALRDRQMNVLIFNTQTEGAVPDQLRGVADAAGVPVVNVTETVPPGAASFADWQVRQLDALRQALGAR